MSGTFYAPVATSLSHTHKFAPKSKTHGQFGPPPSPEAEESNRNIPIIGDEHKEELDETNDEIVVDIGKDSGTACRSDSTPVLPPIPSTPSKEDSKHTKKSNSNSSLEELVLDKIKSN